jgi:hypothetical protein
MPPCPAMRRAQPPACTTRMWSKTIFRGKAQGAHYGGQGIASVPVATESRALEGQSLRDQRQFPRPGQSPKAGLSPLRRSSIGKAPGGHKLHRAATRRITCTAASIVLGRAPCQVSSDTCVERTIDTAQSVHKPGRGPHDCLVSTMNSRDYTRLIPRPSARNPRGEQWILINMSHAVDVPCTEAWYDGQATE